MTKDAMKRPRGVTIIGCLLLIQGLVGTLAVGVLLAAGVLALAQRLPVQLLLSLGVTSVIDWAAVGASALIALLAFVAGVALLLMRPWAWTVAMLLQGYALALNLWSHFQGHPFYLQLFLTVVIVFYLNTHDVYRAFQARRHPTEAQLSNAPDTPNAPNVSVAHANTEGASAQTIAESVSRQSGESGQIQNGSRIV